MLWGMQKPDADEPEDTFEPIGLAARRVLAALAELHLAKEQALKPQADEADQSEPGAAQARLRQSS
jgi:hypothetical protein